MEVVRETFLVSTNNMEPDKYLKKRSSMTKAKTSMPMSVDKESLEQKPTSLSPIH